MWLNGLLSAACGLTCLALAPLPFGVRRTPYRGGLLVTAGACGVLLFVENGLEDVWHQTWAGPAYDVLLAGFVLALLSATVVMLVVPGARWVGFVALANTLRVPGDRLAERLLASHLGDLQEPSVENGPRGPERPRGGSGLASRRTGQAWGTSIGA